MNNEFEKQQIAAMFMKDCHAFRDTLTEQNSDITTQGGTNVWLYKKLAEFEIRLRNLENTNKFIRYKKY